MHTVIVLISEINAICETTSDCYKRRVCCFGVCARKCDVKKRPVPKCRKLQHCARSELCEKGFCVPQHRRQPPTVLPPHPDEQHPIYPI